MIPGALLIRPSSLQFTADNWSAPRPFTLLALTDLRSAADRNVVWRILFAGGASPFSARITDNRQTAFITVAQIDNARPRINAIYIDWEDRDAELDRSLDVFIRGKPNTPVSLDIMAEPQDLEIASSKRLVFRPDKHNEYQRILYTSGPFL